MPSPEQVRTIIENFLNNITWSRRQFLQKPVEVYSGLKAKQLGDTIEKSGFGPLFGLSGEEPEAGPTPVPPGTGGLNPEVQVMLLDEFGIYAQFSFTHGLTPKGERGGGLLFTSPPPDRYRKQILEYKGVFINLGRAGLEADPGSGQVRTKVGKLPLFNYKRMVGYERAPEIDGVAEIFYPNQDEEVSGASLSTEKGGGGKQVWVSSDSAPILLLEKTDPTDDSGWREAMGYDKNTEEWVARRWVYTGPLEHLDGKSAGKAYPLTQFSDLIGIQEAVVLSLASTPPPEAEEAVAEEAAKTPGEEDDVPAEQAETTSVYAGISPEAMAKAEMVNFSGFTEIEEKALRQEVAIAYGYWGDEVIRRLTGVHIMEIGDGHDVTEATKAVGAIAAYARGWGMVGLVDSATHPSFLAEEDILQETDWQKLTEIERTLFYRPGTEPSKYSELFFRLVVQPWILMKEAGLKEIKGPTRTEREVASYAETIELVKAAEGLIDWSDPMYAAAREEFEQFLAKLESILTVWKQQ